METPIYVRDVGLKYYTPQSKCRRMFCEYICQCGKLFTAAKYKVDVGHTKSCGCLKVINASTLNVTHNKSKHPLFSVWSNMHQRCYNTNNVNYKDYGARGIDIELSWHDINNFIEDMFPSYLQGLSLDRIDNNAGYSKSNCRWTTQTEQTRNTRILRKNNTTSFRGVSFNKNAQKYTAQITIKGKKVHLGYFLTPLEAANAFDTYVITNALGHTTNFGSVCSA